MNLLEVEKLKSSVESTQILDSINLNLSPGEVHVIMGPNGSGKSTLSKVIAGHPHYSIDQGDLRLNINGKMQSIIEMEDFERARNGIFLSFQYPIEIEGISNFEFLYESFKAICEHQGTPPMEENDFRNYVTEKMNLLEMNPAFLDRGVNQGFSGGEKKKNEILQMLVLNPRVAILDETDSGLDIDALKIVAKGINSFKSKYNSVCIVTHYQRLLDYIKPDFVHVLSEGKIQKTGDHSLALELESKGYDWIKS